MDTNAPWRVQPWVRSWMSGMNTGMGVKKIQHLRYQ